MKGLKYVLILILAAIGIVMIYLGAKADMLPPLLSGIGFLITAIIFLTHKK